ncbi:MAG: MMPL family transporter [Saprospiraceae bacterium]|nr:MMPL family transporter [Saprospiraceae bacterium]
MRDIRVVIIAVFALLAIASAFFLTRLRFTFDFEQFFPRGDKDLEIFREFIASFETDDNFLLVAVRKEDGAFEQTFLEQFHDFSLEARKLPHVQESQALTQIGYPLKTPFGFTTIPAIHIDDPSRYDEERERILRDDRFVNNLISEDGKTLVVLLKTVNSIDLDQARTLMEGLDELIAGYNFEEYHYLGRAYFQTELVAMQKREIMVSAGVAGVLVSLIMFWIFRRTWGIVIALVSIGLGMLLFMGLLGATGRPLNAMAALYPVLMIIVGTSDVIHIMSKYIDELRKGKGQSEAIQITIKEIGLATLLTSITTAIGFATLLTSRVDPIRDFGLNAAAGVIVAYITVIFFTTALLSYFKADQLMKIGKSIAFWENSMLSSYRLTLSKGTAIKWGALFMLIICGIGISRITTNYGIIDNLPRGEKITEDFTFFEKELTGFRPMELAVYTQGDYQVDDYAVIREMDKIEGYLRQFPSLQAIGSITTLYKSINQAFNNNREDAFVVTENERQFERYRRLTGQLPKFDPNVLVSKDGTKARITSRIKDVGADTIKAMGLRIDNWIAKNIDSDVVKVNRTGTGVIIDKNAEYIRRSLLQGLGIAVLIVSVLMALLFQNWRILIIALVPNIFPLLLAGALIGYLGIELEAGVSIVFAVIFGIAVDDTIHFLSKYKLALNKGMEREEAIKITFVETGKAIVLTSIILFFGFLVMLFSIHPPSVVVGLLISLTLLSALVSDLLLIPVMIRWMQPAQQEAIQKGEKMVTG